MSETEKKRRRARIKRVAKSKRTQTPAIARQQVTYWLARNSDAAGNLAPTVGVFLMRPTRERDENGVRWTCTKGQVLLADGPADIAYGNWSPEVCGRTCGTYPATDLECVRVG